jgi:hypothetical protein
LILLAKIAREVNFMLKVENNNTFLNELDAQRIKHLEMHVKILKDHLERYGQASSLDAIAYIKGQIDLFEREVKIRKDFPNTKT